MKTFIFLFWSIFFLSSFTTNAQLRLHSRTPKASISQEIGVTDIRITYSRPSAIGKIWGGIVPYGMHYNNKDTINKKPWRVAKNAVIEFSEDVLIENKPLKAGKYGVYMVVDENDAATIIFSKNYKAYGNLHYNPSEDALRVDVTSKTIPHTEMLSYEFTGFKYGFSTLSITASLKWGKKEIPFKIVDQKSFLESVREQMQGPLGNSREALEFAAELEQYMLGKDMNQGLVWVNKAIEANARQRCTNMWRKHQLLRELGRQEEADKAFDEAISLIYTAEDVSLVVYTMIRHEDYKRAIQTVNKYIDRFPRSDLYKYLGEAYQLQGNNKKAKQALEQALYLLEEKPNPRLKSQVEKLMNDLLP